MDAKLGAGLLIGAGLLLTFIAMALLVLWARRRGKGSVVTGALLSLFAPDPELEKNIRLAEQARQVQQEEDEEGEDR